MLSNIHYFSASDTFKSCYFRKAHKPMLNAMIVQTIAIEPPAMSSRVQPKNKYASSLIVSQSFLGQIFD